jgi:hypothetical protein
MSMPGMYLSTNARKFFIPSLLSHCVSVGSMVMVPTMTPVDLSRPAGFNVAPTELDG